MARYDGARCPRARRCILAALLIAAIAVSGPAVAPVDAVALEAEDGPGAPLASVAPPALEPDAAAEIVPGSVNRSSLFVDATYDASLRISWGTRKISVDSTATIRNTSGAADRPDRAQHDRGTARQHPAPLGHGRRGRRAAPRGATRRSSSRSAASCRSTPRPGSGSGSTRLLRSSLSGSNWLFTKANGIIDLYRWLPWVSRRIAFDRPNHGDPFETPSSRSVVVRIATSRKLVLATSGDRTAVSADGLTQTFAATNVRDFTVTAATDYRTQVAGRPRLGRARLLPAGSARRRDARRRGRRIRRPRAPARAVSASGRSGSSSRPGRTGWSRRG